MTAIPAHRDWRMHGDRDLDPVLTAAVEAFNEVGYHGATVRDIARRADLSVAGIYHHHAGKQEMLLAILRWTMDDLLWRTAAARREGGADPVRRFANQIESLTLSHLSWRGQALLGSSEMRSLEPDNREIIRLMRVQLQRLIEDDAAQAAAAGWFAAPDLRLAVRGVITMCVQTARWYREEGELTHSEVARRHVRIALAAVEYVDLAAYDAASGTIRADG